LIGFGESQNTLYLILDKCRRPVERIGDSQRFGLFLGKFAVKALKGMPPLEGGMPFFN
jgi:hypothetical protein